MLILLPSTRSSLTNVTVLMGTCSIHYCKILNLEFVKHLVLVVLMNGLTVVDDIDLFGSDDEVQMLVFLENCARVAFSSDASRRIETATHSRVPRTKKSAVSLSELTTAYYVLLYRT